MKGVPEQQVVAAMRLFISIKCLPWMSGLIHLEKRELAMT